MNEALVQHAEHDVDRDQRGENQQRFIRERVLEGGGGALEAGLHAGRDVQILGGFVDCGDGVAQRRVAAPG